MDSFSKNLWRLISLNARMVKNYSTEQIPPPQREANPQVSVHPLALEEGLVIVDVDDDEGALPVIVRLYLWLIRMLSPWDDRLAPWSSVEEAREGLKVFEPLLPKGEVAWADVDSDLALWRWVSEGYGAHRLERVGPKAVEEEKGGFVCRFDFMSRFAVRKGFVPFGGDAYFDARGRVTRIRFGSQDMRPGDAGWAAARFRFRSSSLVWGQLADHFGRSHYHIVNAVLVSTTRHLPKAHPLRRFLKPFLFRTGAANNFASRLLFSKNGFFHRTLAFSWEGLHAALKRAFAEQRMEPFDAELHRKGIHPTELPEGIELPYVVEALAFWELIFRFVNDLLENSPAIQASLTDVATEEWWDGLGGEFNQGRRLEEGLADVLANFLFTLTAYHAQVQNAETYLRDPRFASVRLGEGQVMADRTSNLGLATLLSAVGIPSPLINGDLSPHMPDEGAKAAARRFRQALQELSVAMDRRNAARVLPYRMLEPARVATSITV